MSASASVYPDWPESFDDLVPLPLCEGPKLKPFDFKGKQNIKFLDYVGAGLHAHVFKVEILGQIYALKLFRFCNDLDWRVSIINSDLTDAKTVIPFVNYFDPFNCECRAFGRLQESGYSGLAVECFGYVLLDQDHEDTMLNKFMDKGYYYAESADLKWDFKHDPNNQPYMLRSFRPLFPGKDGRPAPIRGIVKQFCQTTEEDLRTGILRKCMRDVIAIQQLGIFELDVASRNYMDGKMIDFSTAVTTPHVVSNPELNPHIPPDLIPVMEYDVFFFAISDYLDIDEMVNEWNFNNERHSEYDSEHDSEHDGKRDSQRDGEGEKKHISFCIFPHRRYKLRKQRLYSLVDPRRYDWKTFPTGPKLQKSKPVQGRQPKAKKSYSVKPIPIAFRKLYGKPPRWYFDSYRNPAAVKWRKHSPSAFSGSSIFLSWESKDGLLYPVRET